MCVSDRDHFDGQSNMLRAGFTYLSWENNRFSWITLAQRCHNMLETYHNILRYFIIVLQYVPQYIVNINASFTVCCSTTCLTEQLQSLQDAMLSMIAFVNSLNFSPKGHQISPFALLFATISKSALFSARFVYTLINVT